MPHGCKDQFPTDGMNGLVAGNSPIEVGIVGVEGNGLHGAAQHELICQ